MPGISLADVLQYAEETFGRLTCPLCGSHDFTPAAKSADQPIALLYENSGRSWFGPPGYLRVFALSCDTCSYVVMFRLERLEEWQADRQRTGG